MHDQLSESFIEKWSRPEVHFEPFALKTPRSVIDERYLCYPQYLEANPDIERVFMLDLFDIEFFSKPFDLIDDEHYDCGGNRKSVIKLLDTMNAVFDALTQWGELANLNMAIVNKCLYDLFDPTRIMYG